MGFEEIKRLKAEAKESQGSRNDVKVVNISTPGAEKLQSKEVARTIAEKASVPVSDEIPESPPGAEPGHP